MNGYLKNLGTMKEEAWNPEDLVKNNDIVQVKNGKMAGEYILAENLDFIEGIIDNDIAPVVVPIFEKAQLKDNRFGLFENAANTKESVVDKLKNFKSESQSAVKESTIKKEQEI